MIAFAEQQDRIAEQQDRIVELEHGIESVTKTIAESVFIEQAPDIYVALAALNSTDAWQNATLANLQLSDAA